MFPIYVFDLCGPRGTFGLHTLLKRVRIRPIPHEQFFPGRCPVAGVFYIWDYFDIGDMSIQEQGIVSFSVAFLCNATSLSDVLGSQGCAQMVLMKGIGARQAFMVIYTLNDPVFVFTHVRIISQVNAF